MEAYLHHDTTTEITTDSKKKGKKASAFMPHDRCGTMKGGVDISGNNAARFGTY